jgi:hypothetical protein
MPMEACPGCGRHVKVSETACPFCRATLRLAAIGGAVAIASGCALIAPVYGAPPPVSSPSPSAMPTSTPPVAQPLYGAPAPQTPSPNS